MAEQVDWDKVEPISVPELLRRGKPSEVPVVLRVRDAAGRMAELCALLAEAPQLHELSLRDTWSRQMGDQVGTAELVVLGTLTQLTTLDLRCIGTSRGEAMALAQKYVLGALTQLKVLNLRGNSLGEEAAMTLAQKDVLGALKQLKVGAITLARTRRRHWRIRTYLVRWSNCRRWNCAEQTWIGGSQGAGAH